MAYYSGEELVKKVAQEKSDLALQIVNGGYRKIQYFDHEVGWHKENRDEFFICLDGTAHFDIEDNNYAIKKGDIIIIEVVYNQKRLHSGIGYLTPEEYERWLLNQPTMGEFSQTLLISSVQS